MVKKSEQEGRNAASTHSLFQLHCFSLEFTVCCWILPFCFYFDIANTVIYHLLLIQDTLNYDERKPFVLCSRTLTPMYRDSKNVKCSYCSSYYLPEYNGSLCDTCGMATVQTYPPHTHTPQLHLVDAVTKLILLHGTSLVDRCRDARLGYNGAE